MLVATDVPLYPPHRRHATSYNVSNLSAPTRRGANGWGRMRRDSNLAELGITEEEVEEYSAATDVLGLSVRRGANGWGRMRRDSNLAELGITEEEFEEYSAATAKRPRRAGADNAGGDLAGGASLAMGMDVEQPAAAKPSAQRPLLSEAYLLFKHLGKGSPDRLICCCSTQLTASHGRLPCCLVASGGGLQRRVCTTA